MKQLYKTFIITLFSAVLLSCGGAGAGDTGGNPQTLTWIKASGKSGTESLEGVSYGGSRFVAVGESGAIYYSDDGIMWTVAPNPPSTTPSTSQPDPNHRVERLYGVSYGGSRFVAVGDGGDIYYSDDGIMWTVAPNPPSTNHRAKSFYGVSYGGSRFVAVGQSGDIYYSADGEDWTAAPNPPSTSTSQPDPNHRAEDLWGVSYGGSRFVAVGNSGDIYYSADGKDWTAAPNPASTAPNHRAGYLNGVSYGGSRFVAVGPSGAIYYSDNGIMWTVAPNPGSVGDPNRRTHLWGVSYGGNRFVAVADGGAIYYSDNNGQDWLAAPNPTSLTDPNHRTETFWSVSYGGNRFVAVGNSGAIYYSTWP